MPPSTPESNIALTYTHPSTPPHLTHLPLKPPESNELLVKVHAAAINPVDIQLWGNPVVGFLAGKKEKGIGRDYSGEIISIGEQLKGKWHVGDEVFGLVSRPTGEGTFSQYLKVATTDPIAKKPRSWTHEEAAAVPLVVLTAFACLNWLPAEKKEDGARRVIIVSGASGGVGMWCVQLAKRLYNCRVIGICSGRNADFVRKLGADEVIDYTSRNVKQALLDGRPSGRKYDLYVDCVGGVEVFDYWHDILLTSGAYITIVGDKTSRTSMGGPLTYFTYPLQILRFLRGYFFGPRYANVILYQKSELLEKITGLAEKGEAQIVVQDVVKGIVSEEGYREAWEKIKWYMEEGRVRGKVVVDIGH